MKTLLNIEKCTIKYLINVKIYGFGKIITYQDIPPFNGVLQIKSSITTHMVSKQRMRETRKNVFKKLCFTDSLDYLFLIVTAILLIVVLSATILDTKLNPKYNLNHYKIEPKNVSKEQAYLLCFSIVRNWYRLTAPPNTELARDIRFLGPVRYLT